MATHLHRDLESLEQGLLAQSAMVEQIADYATNMAEDVIYLVDGDIAKRRPPSWTAGVEA